MKVWVGEGVGGGGRVRVHYDPRVLCLYHTMFTYHFATLAILDVCLCNMYKAYTK